MIQIFSSHSQDHGYKQRQYQRAGIGIGFALRDFGRERRKPECEVQQREVENQHNNGKHS